MGRFSRRGRASNTSADRHDAFFRPQLQILEERTLLSTFTVMNLNDAGPGSLRAAALAATLHPGEDTIQFRAGLTGTLTLGSTLNLVDDVRIIGPGAGQL